jgi:hypothetical protein
MPVYKASLWRGWNGRDGFIASVSSLAANDDAAALLAASLWVERRFQSGQWEHALLRITKDGLFLRNFGTQVFLP